VGAPGGSQDRRGRERCLARRYSCGHFARTIKELDGLARLEFGGYGGIAFENQLRDDSAQVVFVEPAEEMSVAGKLELGNAGGKERRDRFTRTWVMLRHYEASNRIPNPMTYREGFELLAGHADRADHARHRPARERPAAERLQPIAFGATLRMNPLLVLVATIGFGPIFDMLGLVLGAPLTSAAIHISGDLGRARAAAAAANAEAEGGAQPAEPEPEPSPD
jgi:hypothetical protein